jgi:hypothetical protein
MATNNAVNDASAPFTVSAGNLTVTSGNVLLPTTSSTVGQIQINSVRYLHAFGTDNTFVGSNAGNLTLSGADGNTGIGNLALAALTSGDHNVAIGKTCLTAITTGSRNIGIGYNAADAVSTGSYNVIIGVGSTGLGAASTGNTCVGDAPLYLGGANYNTSLGRRTLFNLGAGSYNLALGQCGYDTDDYYGAGYKLTGTDHSNILIQNPGVAGDVHKLRIGTQGTGDAQIDKAFIAGIYNTAVGATAGVVLSDSTHQLGGLAGAANTVFVGGTKPSFTATPQCTDLTLTGILKLPTTSSTVGQIKINSVAVFHTYGSDNVFCGPTSGNFTLSGAGANCGIGTGTLVSLTSGDYNVAIGRNSGTKISSGESNICIGNSAGSEIATASDNTCIGGAAGYVSTGANNTCIGRSAGVALGSGSVNCMIGNSAGSSISGTGSSNICIMNVGVNGDSNKIRIGTQGTGNGQQDAAYIAGIYNTAVGATAGVVLSDSAHKLGGLAGAANTIFVGGTSPSFTATPQCTDLTLTGILKLPTTSSTVGQIQINSSPVFHTFGTANTFIGDDAGNFTFTTANAINNTAVGYQALDAIVGTGANQGSRNVAVGMSSLGALTEGYYCTGVGYLAGGSLTGSIGSVCLGYNSSSSGPTTGSYNTFLGAVTGNSYTTTDSSNILIGYGITGTSGNDNELIIGQATGTGNGEINSCIICGITGKTSTSGAAVYCNSSNVIGTSTSNRDSKQNIADMGDDSSVIYNLKARTFEFINDTDPKPKQFGMIAEEVFEVFPEMVIYDKDGKPWNLAYQFLAPMLVNEIQKLNKRIEVLEASLLAKGT